MKRTNTAMAKSAGSAGRALKIGQVAKTSGIGIETLRFYEKSGLLDSPSRTESGYRIYNADVLERLDFIKRAQVLGFSLDEIKRIIADKRAGQSPCAEVREIVRRRLMELDARMREMKQYRKELASALDEWDEAGDVPGHVCGLIEGAHIDHGISGHADALRKKKR
ncbi:MAG TPA: heavy metal-responsive transcriptional regulator [Pyrinomonadaceae bacterium]|nr:heavy metal-responsive transcriptional regulator [Pyrinomonadaceae bacterium]